MGKVYTYTRFRWSCTREKETGACSLLDQDFSNRNGETQYVLRHPRALLESGRWRQLTGESSACLAACCFGPSFILTEVTLLYFTNPPPLPYYSRAPFEPYGPPLSLTYTPE